MNVHLDTSFLIRALAPGSSEDRQLRALAGSGARLSMSTVAWAEFLCGPLDPSGLALARRIVPVQVAFAEKEACMAARLFNESGRRRGSLADCMIAATARGADAALATSNHRDFERLAMEGLELLRP